MQELAVMVARSRDGSVSSFPVVETIHNRSILQVVEAPAAVSQDVQQQATALAEKAVACLDGTPTPPLPSPASAPTYTFAHSAGSASVQVQSMTCSLLLMPVQQMAFLICN